MNIVHVNTHDIGGAAIAAYRLHQSLINNGLNSKFLVLYSSGRFPDTETFQPVKFRFFIKKIKSRILNILKYRNIKIQIERSRLEVFTSPDTFYDLANNTTIKQADLIHLHWVANFVDFQTFFKSVNKPIVWTFHDENPFLGGCHYSTDVENLPLELKEVERNHFHLKKRSIDAVKSLGIICPSFWMLQKANESYYSRFNSSVINYGLDDKQFTFVNQKEARDFLKLPNQQIIFSVIAVSLKTHRKGFDLILDLLDFICGICNATLLVVGEVAEMPRMENVICMGAIADSHKLNLIYSSSDALLFPSRQDNLPNVLIESIYCGNPVLGFATGGVPEIIQHGANGLLTNEISSDALKNLILDFIKTKHRFDRNDIHRQAIEKFSIRKQMESVTKLYQESIHTFKLMP